MTDPDDAPIHVAYALDAAQRAPLRLGMAHLVYENERMIAGEGARARAEGAVIDPALWAGLAAGGVCLLAFPLLPGVFVEQRAWLLAPLPLAVAAAWAAFRLLGRAWRKRSIDAFADYSFRFDAAFCGGLDVTLSPSGIVLVNAIERIELGWRRYHCAVLEPDHLVLVFHGSVVALPNALLPAPPKAVAERVNRWVEAAARKAAPELFG